jgi:hypothetical protein
MTRLEDWVARASLANLGNDTMCALSGCTDSRLSQALSGLSTAREGEPKCKNQRKSEKTKTAFNMEKQKKN